MSASASSVAVTVIDGEAHARRYLDRMHAETEQPGELAVLLAYLSGEMLQVARRVIEKTLEKPRDV